MKQIPGEPEPTGEAGLTRSLSQALQGAVFPLSGRQLVHLARENDAPASVLTLLSSLPGGTFGSVAAVQQSLGARVGEETSAVTPVPPVSTPR
ncbi:MAG: DUF2795 domain-containing protein [Cystobacter sp.]